MKSITLKLCLIALALTSGLPSAHATCEVLINSCVVNPIMNGRFFRDSDAAAQIDPDRCFRRARDHVNACGTGASHVITYFSVNGVYKSAIAVYGPNNQLYQTDLSGVRWIVMQQRY